MMVHQLQGRFIRLWNHCNSVAHPGLMSWLKYGGLVTLITQPISELSIASWRHNAYTDAFQRVQCIKEENRLLMVKLSGSCSNGMM